MQMFQGGPSNRAELPEQVADKRAYEDSRPSLSSFVYPEPIKMWVFFEHYKLWGFLEFDENRLDQLVP